MVLTGNCSSRESRVTGQLTDGSRGSRVKKCDPLSSLVVVVVEMRTLVNAAYLLQVSL